MSETPDKTPWHWGHISFEFLKERDSERVRVASVCVVVFSVLVLVAFLYVFVTLLVAMSAGSVEDKAKAGAVLLTTLAALFAAPFLIWRMVLTHQSTKAAQAQAKAAEAKLDIDRETQNTALYLKAVELLGAMKDEKGENEKGVLGTYSKPDMETRIGAMYALDRLARESEKDQPAILDMLCAYVRRNSWLDDYDTRITDFENSRQEEEIGKKTARHDIQTAISIIGKRHIKWNKNAEKSGRIDLKGSNLSNINAIGLDFSDANLQSVSFYNAELTYANLNGAFILNADFSFAQMSGCDIGFLDFNTISNSKNIDLCYSICDEETTFPDGFTCEIRLDSKGNMFVADFRRNHLAP